MDALGISGKHRGLVGNHLSDARSRDQGKGIDLGNIPNPLAPENLLKTSGRGIFLMRSFMDVVEIRPSQTGTEVKLIKHVRGPSAGGKEGSQREHET